MDGQADGHMARADNGSVGNGSCGSWVSCLMGQIGHGSQKSDPFSALHMTKANTALA